MKRVPLKHFDDEFWALTHRDGILNWGLNLFKLDLLESTIYNIDLAIYLRTRRMFS